MVARNTILLNAGAGMAGMGMFLLLSAAMLTTGCYDLVPAEFTQPDTGDGGEDDGAFTAVDLEWADRAGGTNRDWTTSIDVLPSGGQFLVAGRFEGKAVFGAGQIGEKNATAKGVADIFVAKFGGDGMLLWILQAGGIYYDVANDVKAFPDGSFVVVGMFAIDAVFGSSGDDGKEINLSTETGSNDVFIAKYSRAGEVEWVVKAGGTGVDQANRVELFPDGDILVAGTFRGEAVFGEGEENETTIHAGKEDCDNGFLARYGGDGALEWVRKIEGCAAVIGVGVVGDGFVVSGAFSKFATFGLGQELPDGGVESGGDIETLASDGGEDIFLARFKEDGSLRWVVRAGGNGDDEGSAMVLTSDASAILTAGTFSGTAGFGESGQDQVKLESAGKKDGFIARYHLNGTLDWAVRLGGSKDDAASAVAARSDGSFWTAGRFSGTAAFGPGTEAEKELVSPTGAKSVYFALYDALGTPAWVGQGSGNYPAIGGVATPSQESLLVTGSYIDTMTVGPKEPYETKLESAGNEDVFFLRLSEN